MACRIVTSSGVGVRKQGLGRGPARRAGDTAGRPGAGAGDVKAGDGRSGAAQPAGRAERAELVEGEIEVHRVGAGPAPAPLHLLRRVRGDADDAGPKPRSTVLHRLQAPFDELVLARRPSAPD